MKKGETMSEEQKKKTYTLERATKISATHKARGIKPNALFSTATQFKKGVKVSSEVLQKRTATVTGRKRPRQSFLLKGAKCYLWKGGKPKCLDCGILLASYTAKKCKACVMKGESNPLWKGGITPENERIRGSYEMKLWRINVFERDNYTCQICGLYGGYLQADHIKPFAYFPELRFELSNGRTLCKNCHKTTNTYMGRARVLARQLSW